MKTAVFSHSLETRYVNPELWGKIEQLDLSLIRNRMIFKHQWSEEKTDKAILGYQQYLYMTQVFDQPISPIEEVDSVWHEHILHTKKYAIDCEKTFGRFLHHFPVPAKANVCDNTEGSDEWCKNACYQKHHTSEGKQAVNFSDVRALIFN